MTAKANIKAPKEEPKPEGGYTPIADLVKRDEYEKAQEWIEKRIKNINWLLGVVLLVILVAFITVFFSYLELLSVSYDGYSQRMKELNDDRAQQLFDRVEKLESKMEITVAPTQAVQVKE